MKNDLWIVMCAVGLAGCGAEVDEPGAGPTETETSPLGETSCTTLPSQALGTSTSAIGTFPIDSGNCGAARLVMSPTTTYNSRSCPAQYVVEFVETNPAPFGSAQLFDYEIVIDLPQSQCQASGVDIFFTGWRYFAYIGPHWEAPFISRIVSPQRPRFANGRCSVPSPSMPLTAVEDSQYNTRFRFAVQGRVGGVPRKVGVLKRESPCIR